MIKHMLFRFILLSKVPKVKYLKEIFLLPFLSALKYMAPSGKSSKWVAE